MPALNFRAEFADERLRHSTELRDVRAVLHMRARRVVADGLLRRADPVSPGPYITISPDGNPSDDPIDEEQREAFGDYVEWDSSTGEE